MAKFQITDDRTGFKYEIESDEEPSQDDILAEIDRMEPASEAAPSATPPAPVETPGFFDTLKAAGSSMVPKPGQAFIDTQRASEGIGETIADVGNAVIPWLTNPGGAIADKITGRDQAPILNGEEIDPYASVIAGSGAALGQVFQPVAGPLMMADRGVREAGARLGAAVRGDTLSPERSAGLRRYTLEGTPSEDITEISIPDAATGNESIDTALNTGGRLAQDVGNYPITTVGTAKAGNALSRKLAGPSAPPESLAPKVPKEVKLIRTVARPVAGTKFSKNFNEAGGDGLRMIAEEPAKTADPAFNAKTGFENAEGKLATPREEMITQAKQKGKTVSLKPVKSAVSRLTNDPVYDAIDPDGAVQLERIASKISDGEVTPDVAQEIYTSIERQLRQAKKLAGDRADALEESTKFQAWDTIRETLGKQLNETVSRTPNEYLENSRSFSNLYNTWDRIERAIEVYGNNPKSLSTWRDFLSIQGAKDSLMRLGFSRNTLTDLQQSMNMASKGNIPAPTPFGPQKPSTLPQR